MPLAATRPSYQVSTLVVTTLVLIGLGVQAIRRLIPPPEPNALSEAQGDYYQQAASQQVPWLPYGPHVYREARKRDRPILLVVGATWSRLGRMLDLDVLTDRDVIEKLKQRFVCTRIDLDRRPHYATALLPLDPRCQRPLDVGCQLYVVDAAGYLLHALLLAPRDAIDAALLLSFLRKADDLYRTRRSGPQTDQAAWAQQEQTALLAGGAQSESLDYEAHAAKVAARVFGPDGGVTTDGVVTVDPFALRFLLRTGRQEQALASMRRALSGPTVDWLDGGFFRLAAGTKLPMTQFDKLATHNAEAMLLFAQAGQAFDDPIFRRVALDTFDSLDQRFATDGLIRAARIGGSIARHRSRRYSFSVVELRQSFTPIEREWLRAHMGLVVERNPQMTVRLVRPETLLREPAKWTEMIRRLRDIHRDVDVRYSQARPLDVNATCAARMLETARLLQDSDRLARAAAYFDRLAAFRSGPDDVLHSIEPDPASYAYLGDYLAYADAAMQHYLAFGNPLVLHEGLAVLCRGIELFRTEPSDTVCQGPPEDPEYGLKDVHTPGISDDFGESTTAKVIRLAHQYHVVASESANASGLDAFASSQVARLAWVANRAQLGVSGFFDAAMGSFGPMPRVSTRGPNAITLASEIYSQAPFALVLATEEGRHELAAAPPVTVVVGGKRYEANDVASALALLGRRPGTDVSGTPQRAIRP